ncbi:hypothetical protein C3L33_02942, partial [Rhododendron williamsianum]
MAVHLLEIYESRSSCWLPSPHFAYVKNISPGLPLFLFNYSDRKLYGIFEAASHGQMNINAYGWTGDGAEYSPYPAQFRPVIADNYYEQRLFWFELDWVQTRHLKAMFLLAPVDTSVSLPRNMPRCNTLAKSLPTSGRRHVLDKVEAPFSEAVSAHSNQSDVRWGWSNTNSSVIGNANTSHQQKTWSSLFKNSTTSQTTKEDQDLGAQAPESNFPHSDQSNMECDSLSVPPWLEGEILNYEALPEDSAMWNYEEVHAGSESGWELSCSSVQKRTAFEEKEGVQATSYDLAHLEDSNVGWGSSCATRLLDGERSPHPFATDEVNLEDGCSPEVQEVEEMNSSSIQSVVAKLMQEIGGLKVSQLKQVQKISCLEQELVESKVEIQQLKKQCHVLESRSPFSIGRVDDSILIVGGFDGCSWLSTLDSYSPSEDTMKSLKPMTCVRSYASQATLNGDLYVLGGVDGDMWHDTVESYNPTSNQWVSQPSLNQKKGSLAGASLCGKIFVVGGGNGLDCYSEMWSIMVTTLGFAYESPDPIRTGTPYALGGYNGAEMVPTVEIFEPRVGSWMMGEPMTMLRVILEPSFLGGKYTTLVV